MVLLLLCSADAAAQLQRTCERSLLIIDNTASTRLDASEIATCCSCHSLVPSQVRIYLSAHAYPLARPLTTMHRCLCLRSPRNPLTSFFGSLICFEDAASLGESCLTYSSCSKSSGRRLSGATSCKLLSIVCTAISLGPLIAPNTLQDTFVCYCAYNS